MELVSGDLSLTNNHFVTLGHQTHYPDSKPHSVLLSTI